MWLRHVLVEAYALTMERLRVGISARISEDIEGSGLGVARQVRDCKAIADLRGWDVADQYVDNDVSAYKRNVRRPEFERMLCDLSSGAIDGAVVYDLDRFARQPSDLERAIVIFEDRPGLVFASVQGDINLQTPDGKTMARVMVAFANKSSMDTGRRVARKHLENARLGKPVGGYRPFGWQADKATLDTAEAGMVRQAVGLILAGASLRSVVRAWNAAGVPTSAGGQWKLATLRQYLRSPRLVGLRVHRGEVLLDDTGRPVRGLWEPMLDRDTYDRLQLVIVRPEVRSRVPRRNARHYLLTGTVRCGVCNQPMYGNRYAEGRHYYRCSGEGHTLSVSGHGTDALVRELVLARLSTEDVGSGPRSVWAGEGELATVERKIAELMAAFDAGRLTGDLVFPRVAALQEQQAQMRESRAQWLVSTTGPATHPISRAEWDGMSMDLRRGHVERLLSAVLVRPSRQQQNRLDPQRLVPVWRGPEGRPGLVAAPG